MLKIKIGENEYPIDKFGTFTTQFGNNAVRIYGDVPLADNGFMIYDDDVLIGDMSNYKYLLREDDKCKEYTEVEEQIVPCESFLMGDVPPSGYDILSRRISAVNSRVSDITPYEQTKTAYYGEIEKVFYGVPDGNVTVFFDKYNGEYKVSRIEDRLTVSFPRLTDMTNITVMVQQ